MLSTLRRGDHFVVTERWRGRLWSAVPHTLVQQCASQLISFVQAGTIGTFATSRGIAGREQLDKAERKLAALRTSKYNVADVVLDLDTLNFFTPGRAARVNLGWENGNFIGWYVNFELPPTAAVHVVTTMDWILDALVTPEGDWQWKDRADFDQAVSEGLLDVDVHRHIERAEEAVRSALSNRTEAFADRWIEWRSGWRNAQRPVLPLRFTVDGSAWTT